MNSNNHQEPKFTVEVAAGLAYFFIYPILTMVLLSQFFQQHGSRFMLYPGVAFLCIVELFIRRFVYWLSDDPTDEPSTLINILDAGSTLVMVWMVITNNPIDLNFIIMGIALGIRVIHVIRMVMTILASQPRK